MMKVIDKGKEVCIVLNEDDYIKIMSNKDNGGVLFIENKNGTLCVSEINKKGKQKNEKNLK